MERGRERERAVRNWQLQTFSFYQMEAIRSLVEWKSFEDFHLIRCVSVGHLLPLCSFDSMAQGAPKERAARRSSVWVPKSKQLGRTTKPWQALLPFCSSAMLAKDFTSTWFSILCACSWPVWRSTLPKSKPFNGAVLVKRLQETMAHMKYRAFNFWIFLEPVMGLAGSWFYPP